MQSALAVGERLNNGAARKPHAPRLIPFVDIRVPRRENERALVKLLDERSAEPDAVLTARRRPSPPHRP